MRIDVGESCFEDWQCVSNSGLYVSDFGRFEPVGFRVVEFSDFDFELRMLDFRVPGL